MNNIKAFRYFGTTIGVRCESYIDERSGSRLNSGGAPHYTIITLQYLIFQSYIHKFRGLNNRPVIACNVTWFCMGVKFDILPKRNILVEGV
jgi:hypothetical protein